MKDVLYERIVDTKGYIYFAKNVCADGKAIILHVHNAAEFKFITYGDYYMSIGGEERVCHQGEAAFVSPRRVHFYKSIGDSENYVLVVDNEILKAVCPKGKAFRVYMGENAHFDEIKTLLETTIEKWDSMNKYERRGFVFRLLGMVLEYYEVTEAVHDKKDDIAAQILEYIESNFNKEITLEMLSDKFGYSKNYFSNLFNKTIKMNLREYLNRCRINNAVRIMKEYPELPLWSVSEKVGYVSFVTFYRAYKRYADEDGGETY